MEKGDGQDATRMDLPVRDLTASELDRYYFEVLKRIMECTYDTYVAGYRVWDHEVIWHQRNASRLGYLIFGPPSPETELLPPRDFSLYIIPPFSAPRLPADQPPDAAWLRLETPDPSLRETLTRYVAALETAAQRTGDTELDYENRAATYLHQLYRWIDTHALYGFRLTFGGETVSLGEWCHRFGIPEQGCIPSDDTSCLRNLLNEVAGACLSDHFTRQAPDYPAFPLFIPRNDRGRILRETLRHLAGGPASPGSRAVLRALRLLNGGRNIPLASPYAAHILDVLDADPSRTVLRRTELIPEPVGHGYLFPVQIRLEAEWGVVLLASLLQAGEIAMIVGGERYLGDRLRALVTLPLDDLLFFDAVERLPGWNRQALQALCTHLDLPGEMPLQLVRGETEPIRKLGQAAAECQSRLDGAGEMIAEGFPFWGAPLLSEGTIREWREDLAAAGGFLDALQRHRNPEALRDFLHDPARRKRLDNGMAVLREIESLHGAVHGLCHLAGYLTAAEALLPTDHPWVQAVLASRDTLRREMADPLTRGVDGWIEGTQRSLIDHREAFIQYYRDTHNPIASDIPCRRLHQADLRHSPLCPFCRFKPWER